MSFEILTGASFAIAAGAVLLVLVLTIVTMSNDRRRLIAKADARKVEISDQFVSMLDAVPDGVLTVDAAQQIASANRAAHRIFGYQPGGLIGKPLEILIPRKSQSVHRSNVARFLSEEKVEPVSMNGARPVAGKKSDGSEIKISVSLAAMRRERTTISVAIIRDVSDVEEKNRHLEKLSQELEGRLHDLEVANKSKSRFISTMSHEIRTPLNAIIGFAELLTSAIAERLTEKDKTDYIKEIRNAGGQLLAIVNDILDLSRLESGTTKLNMGKLDVRPAIVEVLRTVHPLAQSRNITIRARRIPKDLSMYADQRAARQVLLNIMSNAIKFSKPGSGRIYVSVNQASEQSLTISIRDNGVGIPSERINDLGKPFVQIGNVYQAETKGTGLGLAISTKLMIQMGGKLILKSEFGAWTEVAIEFQRSPGTFETR